MPKIPAQKVPSQMKLRELSELSSEYAEKATRISDLVEEAEQFLCSMPGKVEARVEDGDYVLRFDRSHNKKWGLKLDVPDEHGDPYTLVVTESAIDVKATAVGMFPTLFDELLDTMRSRLKIVKAGLESESELEALFGKGDDE